MSLETRYFTIGTWGSTNDFKQLALIDVVGGRPSWTVVAKWNGRKIQIKSKRTDLKNGTLEKWRGPTSWWNWPLLLGLLFWHSIAKGLWSNQVKPCLDEALVSNWLTSSCWSLITQHFRKGRCIVRNLHGGNQSFQLMWRCHVPLHVSTGFETFCGQNEGWHLAHIYARCLRHVPSGQTGGRQGKFLPARRKFVEAAMAGFPCGLEWLDGLACPQDGRKRKSQWLHPMVWDARGKVQKGDCRW